MNRLRARGWLALLALVASAGAGGAAPAEAQEVSHPVIALSSDEQSPGNVALISLTLRAPDGVGIGKAVAEVSYPGKVLVFREAVRGFAAEAVGASVSAATRADGENTVAVITVAAREGERLPNGALAQLRFEVPEEAPKELTVPLKNRAAAWSDATPPAPVESVQAGDGEVRISTTAPLPACFFYMH